MNQEFIEDLIRRAGALAVRGFGAKHRLAFKAEGIYQNYPQVVSPVDVEVEKFIVNEITREYPEHSIVAEESAATRTLADWTWIIDPLDGTANFTRSVPLFSVSIALAYQGEVQFGAVYAPILGDVYSAARNRGARCNGEAIQVSQTENLDMALVGSSVQRSFQIRDCEQALLSLMRHVRNLRMFASTALEICWVASGRLDARVFAHSEIWDHAAAGLVLEEAGGRLTDWRGSRWDLTTRQLLASNGLVHEDLLRVLRGNV